IRAETDGTARHGSVRSHPKSSPSSPQNGRAVRLRPMTDVDQVKTGAASRRAPGRRPGVFGYDEKRVAGLGAPAVAGPVPVATRSHPADFMSTEPVVEELRTSDKKPGSQERCLIIGAGPAGLTAAYELSKLEIPAVIFEADQIVGGIARTASHNG